MDNGTVLLTPEQLAQRTGLARATLAKLRLTSRGPVFTKVGASVRYDSKDVESWLASLPRKRSTSDTGDGR